MLNKTPRIAFERDRKRYKSVGAKSGEYGKCGSTSQPCVWITSLVILAIWGRALSCSERTFLMNTRVELFHLLNIELRVDRLVPFKQFIMDNPFPVPPYVQHHFTRIKILFHTRCRLFTGAKPFLALLYIDIQAPFFVPRNDLVKKSLLVSMS